MAENQEHHEHDAAAPADAHEAHAHGDPFHAHPTGELNTDDFDAANRSLAEALRISFGILRFVVIALLIAFVAEGSYNEINQGQVGIVLRFGAPQGAWVQTSDGDRRFVPEVLEPGAHFVFPQPIDRVIAVPTSAKLVEINDAFWFEERESERNKPLEERGAPVGGLQPGRDGSLLTSDKNIVHGKWSVGYRITPEGAVDFARNIGAEDIKESLRRAERVVRDAVEAAIVHVVASTEVDQFVVSNVDRQKIKQIAHAKLERMNAGIEITDVFLNTATPPVGPVLAAFNEVNNAQSAKAQRIEEARREQQRVLTETAGRGYAVLDEAIESYEQARAAGNDAAIESARARIDEMLASPEALAAHRIGGDVAELIDQADADRTELEASVQSEADAFLSQYDKFKDDPTLERIIRDRLRQDALQAIFTDANVETFWLPRDVDELYMELSRDPDIRRQRGVEARRERMEGAPDQNQ